MRRCVLCARDREDVSLTRVAPAAWTGFNNFVGICAECQASDAYRKLVKQKKVITRVADSA